MDTRGRFQLHLPGLLKVLAEHLYSTRKVGVRELLQNAHDSCVRRAVEHPDPDYRPRIDLSADAATRTLRFADNGSGLTEAEIHQCLTVIGRGYTRELRDRLAADDHRAAGELVGQFGIGFLAAFLLASRVTLHTRPAGGGPPLQWESVGDESFEMGPGDRTEPGTTVELELKPAALFLLHLPNLTDTVRAYADFLPTPVHVQGAPAAANLGAPPWDGPDPAAACREYARRRSGGADPLWILPLEAGTVDLGHDTLTVPLAGFLFVPPESVASVKEYGDTAVFIRGMAVCDAEKDLLPPWARFVRGVVDAPGLQPTASREAVHQDAAFDAVRTAVADQLGRGLRRLAANDPAAWRRVAHGHGDVVMGWAVKDPEFFRLVADVVPLRTTRGRLTLPEYIRAAGSTVYYVTRELGTLQDKLLAEGRDVAVVDASWFAVPAFLECYAAARPGVSLVRLDDDPGAVLPPARAADLGDLPGLCEELGLRVRVSSFRPADLPAVMIYPANAEAVREVAAGLAADQYPAGFSGLLRAYVDREQAAGADAGILYLNAACPLLRRLAAGTVTGARRQAAVAVVAHFARLFCGRVPDAAAAATELAAWHRSLDYLVGP